MTRTPAADGKSRRASASSVRWPMRAREMRGPWAAAGMASGACERARRPARGLAAHRDRACGGRTPSSAPIAAALRRPPNSCSGADAVVLCVGEAADDERRGGDPRLPGSARRTARLAEAVLDARACGGKSGRRRAVLGPAADRSVARRTADAVLAAWFLGCEAGNAIADVRDGRRCRRSGRTPISWPRALGQVPIFFGQRHRRPARESERPFHQQVSRRHRTRRCFLSATA